MSQSEIIVDCYGHATAAASLDVSCDGTVVQFVFPDRKPAALRAHLGLYVDYTATAGRDYLRYPKARRAALLCEPNASLPFVDAPTLADRFSMVLTHDARLLERGSPYVETPFGTSFLEGVVGSTESFPKTRLASMIGAPHANPKAGHILRNQVIEALAGRSDVDRFGKGVRWIDSKREGLADYAFSIAMENCNRDFYFTEKIIDCFLTDTVPIYCGCPSITKYFDPRGLLVFDSLPELLQHLEKLDWNLYHAMLPFVRSNRDRAIEAGWATRAQLFERVGRELQNRLGPFASLSRVPVFRRFQDAWRKKTRKSL